MAAELTSGEMTDLLAMDWLEPDVGARIDQGFAQVLHLVYARTRGKNEPERRVEDFMPQRGPIDRKKVAQKARNLFGGQRAIMAEIEREKRRRSG